MYARHHAGFTLVELTIVLVVLGISAGLALPGLSGLLAREGEKSAARILTGVLRRARSEAILTGQPWRVDIDWDKGECRLEPTAPQKPLARTPASRGKTAANSPKTASPPASATIDAAMTPKAAPTIPAVKLPGNVRPRLAVASGRTIDQPAVVSIVVRPEGLCQPAFIRLPGSDGADAALTVSPVGCRVAMVTADPDTAQARFEKSQGLADPPWADAAAGAGR